MAGIAPAPSGRGGRRALDAAVNLVPFIDLLSCCISFLLITAVWSQLAQLDVHRAGGGGDAPPGEPPPKLTVAADGFVLEIDGGAHELSLLSEVSSRLRGWPGPHDNLQVRVGEGVVYARVMSALDAARGAGFTNLVIDD